MSTFRRKATEQEVKGVGEDTRPPIATKITKTQNFFEFFGNFVVDFVFVRGVAPFHLTAAKFRIRFAPT